MSDTETDAPVDHAALAEQSRDNVDAWISGDPKKMEWANRPDHGIPDRKPGESVYRADPTKGDDQVYAKLEAPKGEAAIAERAATTLAELGPEGHALVQEWGGHTSHDFRENLAYAREAFRDIAANRPDLIAKVDASGLGNDPAILKFLAEHGRRQSNFMGDFTVARNGTPPSEAPAYRGNGSKASLATELAQIRKDNPVGSQGYKQRAVQDRIMQINEALYGTGNIVGQGGRTG
jgi:hypothetical protein